MQHISVVAVGKAGGFYADGVAEYAKRMQGMCRFAVTEVAEEPLRERGAGTAMVDAVLRREGERLLAAVPKGARLVALCVEGKGMTTEGFTAYLDDAAMSGEGTVAFVIGGSHGLSDEVKRAAAMRISLSEMTLPHQLARLVLAEQIYRALMMRAGRTYHK